MKNYFAYLNGINNKSNTGNDTNLKNDQNVSGNNNIMPKKYNTVNANNYNTYSSSDSKRRTSKERLRSPVATSGLNNDKVTLFYYTMNRKIPYFSLTLLGQMSKT